MKPLSYTPESDQTRYISAYYYSIPNLCYGQWAEFVTVSSHAYGATGQSGSTTTSGGSTGYSLSYLDYLNYYNYYNSYYGNSYYGSYYDNYYYNYYNSLLLQLRLRLRGYHDGDHHDCFDGNPLLYAVDLPDLHRTGRRLAARGGRGGCGVSCGDSCQRFLPEIPEPTGRGLCVRSNFFCRRGLRFRISGAGETVVFGFGDCVAIR